MNYIDLFAGAGGLSEGFKKAGFQPIAHIEMDLACCFTLKTRLAYYYLKENNKSPEYILYLKGEINRDQLYSLIPSYIFKSVINMPISDQNNPQIFQILDRLKGRKDIDVIIGGPPCQAYSLVGRARDQNGMKGDPRNYLYVQYGRFLKQYKPKIFIFENVKGLLSAGGGQYFKNIKMYFRSLGYQVEPIEVNARNFGILQNRERLIIIGWQKELNISIGKLTTDSKSIYKVQSIFEDLPKLSAGEGKDKYTCYIKDRNNYLKLSKIRDNTKVLTQHVARPHTQHDQEVYRIAVQKWKENHQRLRYGELPERLKTHHNQKAFLDRFKVVADDLPYSQTIVAHIAKDGHYYIHPDINQNRSISVREAARLQSFPDDYYFEGVREGSNRTAAFMQVGNAVPPLLIEKIAEMLKGYIRS